MRRGLDEHEALALATKVGARSPCAKSKRGVVLFCRTHGLLGAGHNHPPETYACDDSPECRASCNKVCVHAEMDALADFCRRLRDGFPPHTEVHGALTLEMVHVKVVDGKAVASGEPSCWQCSRHVVNFGIKAFWLVHEDGLRRYGPHEFHEHTLRTCGLPVIR